MDVEIIERLATRLGLTTSQIRATVALLEEGNTVPFIARYRKERTGNLDEVQIRDIERGARELEQLEQRRATILASIEELGMLSAELRRQILEASELARLEDLYAPYRPKRMTRAKRAIEAGLDPLADALLADEADLDTLADQLRGEDFPDREAVYGGARDIIAERIADDAEVRDHVRNAVRRHGKLASKKRRGAEEERKFEIYFEFASPLDRLRPHQLLAVRRGEKERILSAGLAVDGERLTQWIKHHRNPARRRSARQQIDEAIDDGFKRLLMPAVERDLRAELEATADAHAISVFALNLKNLLMQPPLPGRRVLGLDPGMRTGCKLAIVDDTGKLLHTDQIYVHDRRKERAPDYIAALIDEHLIDVVAIGNGTGGRESEEVVAEALRASRHQAHYTIVDEAGASVYSASDIAREEFPDLDVALRGAVSIARRIQDPLAELVKIDPKSIGVGMYQHDVNQGRLQEQLEAVVEDVVNAVGIDVNLASAPLLAQVAGIGPALARRIVNHRDEHGRFAQRDGLHEVRGMGTRTFEQCAGFLRIHSGDDPLDATGIHPDHYAFARAVLQAAELPIGSPRLEAKLAVLDRRGRLAELAAHHDIGPLTMNDVLDALVTPGRDPRQAVDPPLLRSDVLTIDDLHEGMRLTGTVRNVVDFGAFVDIGVKQDGLVHISEMADHFVRDPYAVVGVGDAVDVRVLSVDKDRGRIGLSMKHP